MSAHSPMRRRLAADLKSGDLQRTRVALKAFLRAHAPVVNELSTCFSQVYRILEEWEGRADEVRAEIEATEDGLPLGFARAEVLRVVRIAERIADALDYGEEDGTAGSRLRIVGGS